MKNTSSSNFFNALEQRERKGRIIFLALAFFGSVLTTVAAFTAFRAVGLLPYLSYIFWDDDLVGSRLTLFNQVYFSAAIITPLLQIALYIIAFFGRGWARVILAVFNSCNFFVAALFVFSASISTLGGELYKILFLLLMAFYYLLSCVILFGNKSVKEFIGSHRLRPKTAA